MNKKEIFYRIGYAKTKHDPIAGYVRVERSECEELLDLLYYAEIPFIVFSDDGKSVITMS
jgi:hypothetical protein